MIDIIFLKIKKALSLTPEEEEFIFLQALQQFIDNTDEVAYSFIKTNLEHLISGYISESEVISSRFIEDLAQMASQIAQLEYKKQADGVYFMVRYLITKRKERAAMRYAVLFLHQLKDEDRIHIDKLTLDYLEYFATKHSHDVAPSDKDKEILATAYSGLEKNSSRHILTPEFLENPFHPYFKEYDPQIHRILAMSTLAQLKQNNAKES